MKSIVFLLRRKPVLQYKPNGERVLFDPDNVIDSLKPYVKDNWNLSRYSLELQTVRETYKNMSDLLVVNYSEIQQ